MSFEENIKKLNTYLERFKSEGVFNNIHGKYLKAFSGQTFKNISPVDESEICSVPKSGKEDIDAAVSSAKEAFFDWKERPSTERKKILNRIADGILERADEIAICESWDTGQPIRFMSKAAIRGAENFRFFAEKSQKIGYFTLFRRKFCLHSN